MIFLFLGLLPAMLHGVRIDATDWAVLVNDVLPALGVATNVSQTPIDCGSQLASTATLLCDTTGRVQVLSVVGVTLNGTLSPRLAQLAQLRELVLRNTGHVSGTVPAALSLLALRRIDVRGNALTGTGLAALDWSALAEVQVAANRFVGDLPHPARLAALERLDVAGGNAFSTLPGSRADWQALPLLSECRLSVNATGDNCFTAQLCGFVLGKCACVPTTDVACANGTNGTTLTRSTLPSAASVRSTLPSTLSQGSGTSATKVPCDLRRSCGACVTVSRPSVNASFQAECAWCFVELENGVDGGYCQTVLKGVEPRCVGELQAFLVTCPSGDRVVDWSLLIVTAVLLTVAAFGALCVGLYISRMRIEQRSMQMRKAIQDEPIITEVLVDQLVNGPLDSEVEDDNFYDAASDESAAAWAAHKSSGDTSRRSRANTPSDISRRSRANTPSLRTYSPPVVRRSRSGTPASDAFTTTM